jgi:hypothetical protein
MRGTGEWRCDCEVHQGAYATDTIVEGHQRQIEIYLPGYDGLSKVRLKTQALSYHYG